MKNKKNLSKTSTDIIMVRLCHESLLHNIKSQNKNIATKNKIIIALIILLSLVTLAITGLSAWNIYNFNKFVGQHLTQIEPKATYSSRK